MASTPGGSSWSSKCCLGYSNSTQAMTGCGELADRVAHPDLSVFANMPVRSLKLHVESLLHVPCISIHFNTSICTPNWFGSQGGHEEKAFCWLHTCAHPESRGRSSGATPSSSTALPWCTCWRFDRLTMPVTNPKEAVFESTGHG